MSFSSKDFGQTLPDELKRKYKTTNRIINYILKQIENWTGKHIKNKMKKC